MTEIKDGSISYSLIPCSTNFNEYCGIISCFGRRYRISTRLKECGGMIDVDTFHCDPELSQLLCEAGVIPALRVRLASSPNMKSALEELKDILTQLFRTKQQFNLVNVSYYTRLLDEIEKIGWGHLVIIDQNLSHLELQVSDQNGRDHILGVTLPPNFPRSAPVCVADLPIAFDLHWNSDCSSLADVLSQFKSALEPFLPFWDVLDDLDSHAWVLEPENRSHAIVERRIALAPHCSLFMSLNPLAPKAIPEIKIFGAQSTVVPLKKALAENLHRWNTSTMLRKNIESILGLTLPSPRTISKEDISGDCGICYQYKGQQGYECEVPDRVCDNPKCNRPYHPSCLFTWLQALPESRTSFGTTFGSCPYCSADISVKNCNLRSH